MRPKAALSGIALTLMAGTGMIGSALARDTARPPIRIVRQGSFSAGGVTIGEPGKATLHCDHGFIEYQIPQRARKQALLLWHSASVQGWQMRWDGGEGYQSLFLRRGWPVYLWDGPRVGRANWGCEAYSYTPKTGADQQNFTSWRFGDANGNWFPDVQFPTQDKAAWDQATSARYDEFDTPKNATLEAAAAAKALERIGPTILVTNSAGGWRALLAAMQTSQVKAIIAYENPGYVFPDGEGPQTPTGPFGPSHVSLAAFMKLTRIPIQFVWGDNIDKSPVWSAQFKICQDFVRILNAHGGHAEILTLPSIGLKGNTHLPFADMNNVAVADQLSAFLRKNGLDKR